MILETVADILPEYGAGVGGAGTGMDYLARCHCGALKAHYRTTLPPGSWPVRACQCAFCTAHGALSTSDPNGALSFSITEPALLQRYQFGTRSADFLICRTCGVYLGAVMTDGSERRGILNVRTLEPAPIDLPAPQPMQYGAESTQERGKRRVARWTPLEEGSL
jgi:hypothetical protein